MEQLTGAQKQQIAARAAAAQKAVQEKENKRAEEQEAKECGK